jgi:hypothetical protein
MSGAGYGGEELTIEETSNAGNHYELLALARVLAEGLGLTAGGQDRLPYLAGVLQSLESSRTETALLLTSGVAALKEIRDRIPTSGGGSVPEGLDGSLDAIRSELAQMRTLLQAGHEAGEAIRQQAQGVLLAHAEAAKHYVKQMPPPPSPDSAPFESLPAGTSVRELPDGGRLFGLPTGDQIRVSPDGTMGFIGAGGDSSPLAPVLGRQVPLPGGMALTLQAEAVRVTHEAAGIAGLPDGVEPERVAEARYSVALPGDIRLDVHHTECSAVLINPAGTVVCLSPDRIEGIGETVEVTLLPGGSKSFAALESGHRGVVEAEGPIHLALSNGLDLVVHFPESGTPENDSGCGGVCGIQCEERTL